MGRPCRSWLWRSLVLAALLLSAPACSQSDDDDAAASDPSAQAPAATGGASSGGLGGQAATQSAMTAAHGGSSGSGPTERGPLGGASGANAGAASPAGSAAIDAASGSAAGDPARTGSGGSAGSSTPDAGATDAATSMPFALTAVGASMLSASEYAFPADARPPTNRSPEFSWTGVPKEAKSLALVFRDLDNRAVKWILWDIPPTVTRVPAGVMPVARPSEVAGSSQLGSLSNQGYAGPCCPERQYEWVLWALDSAQLPATARLSTAQIYTGVLPEHDLATTEPLIMRIMP